MKKQIFYLLIVVLIPAMLAAQTALPVKKISIFKNSTTMVSKEGQMKANNSLVKLPVPAEALFGTYWLGTAKENDIKGVVFKNDTIKTNSKAKYISQLLQGNTGNQVSLSYKASETIEKTVTGKILEYLPESNLTKLKLDDGKTAYIDSRNIYNVVFANDNNNTYKNDSIVRSAFIKTASENVTLQEYYMELGLNWLPSYFLKLTNDKEAHLEMKALVENYAENLTEVETEVVVGSPQLFFGKTLDPMTYDYVSTPQYTTPKPQFDNNMLSNAIQTQSQSGGNYGHSMREEDYFTADYSTEGEKNNDLYYYNLGKITLLKNNKGIFPIFGSNLAYKDKYEATIPDKVNYATSLYCDNSEGLYDVFHSVELKNATANPFTTAPVMVITDKDQFLAQDQLKYTPVGASTTIKLSKAIDIILKNQEEETTRTDNVKKIGKTMYSKVALKGTITVENMQKKAVSIDVTKSVTGSVTYNGTGTVKKQKTYNSVNPYSDVKWEVELAAGEKKTLTYEYEVLFVPYQY